MGNEFGDTLVACVECGAVVVAEKVTNDEAIVESAAKSGKAFVGKACRSCAVGPIPSTFPISESSWRLLKGPLRVPRK